MNSLHKLLRQGLLLEYITLGWNIVGVVIVIGTAIASHSVALAGFGLDSLIEIGASTVVIWELTDAGHTRRKTALRRIAIAFFGLVIYVLVHRRARCFFKCGPRRLCSASSGWYSHSW